MKMKKIIHKVDKTKKINKIIFLIQTEFLILITNIKFKIKKITVKKKLKN